MTSKFNIESNNRYAPTGYEGQNYADYVIPSCGLEDLDKAVFNLFDKDIPLFYQVQNEQKKVPVIFATGERFALLRRRQPIIDIKGAHILPLVSIVRSNIDNVPPKGISNNQMFPNIIKKRIAKKDLEYRQNKNMENFSNVKENDSIYDADFSLNTKEDKHIIETIEMPAVKYFGASYEITIWSSFTQQMNNILETIMSSYTLNPGQQFRIESDKGYKFSAFVDSSFSPDTNYADFTDAERYIKYSMNISTTGYIIAPNIQGGKTALRSFLSAPEISFEVLGNPTDLDPQINGSVVDPDPNAHIYDDLSTEDSYSPAQNIGKDGIQNMIELLQYDKSKGRAVKKIKDRHATDYVGERGSDYTKSKKTFVKDNNNRHQPVEVLNNQIQGETVYDSRFAEVLFNISTNKE